MMVVQACLITTVGTFLSSQQPRPANDMEYCQSCGQVKGPVIAEGVYYCNKCLSKREFVMHIEVPNERTGSKDQQFQGFEEVIFEKEPMSKGLFSSILLITTYL
jgi:hypothetical protein